MKVILREDAVKAITAGYGVDLSDWLHVSYPDKAAQHAAVVVVELQLEIMQCKERGNAYAASMIRMASQWRHNVSGMASTMHDLALFADRIEHYRRMVDLAIVPFLPRKES